MKNLLSLTDITRTELNDLLELATQMRRMVLADYKRGPQLIGQAVGGVWKKPCTASAAIQLATAYLSGTCVPLYDVEDELAQGLALDSMGVSTLVMQCDNDNIFRTLSLRCRAGIVNGGSRRYDPIGVLADLLTLCVKADGISNLNVVAVGNRDANKVEELTHCLRLFGSDLVWYLPTEDMATARRGVVLDNIRAAFAGADAVIDLGLTAFSEYDKYYGSSGGITRDLMDTARVHCPLLGANTVVEGALIKEYEYSALSARHGCYVAAAMAVLYALQRK